MTAIRSLSDLKRFREEVLEKNAQNARLGNTQVIVGMGSCGIAAGALHTMKAILDQIESQHLQGILVSQTGCNGQCEAEPIVHVIAGDQKKVTYGKVTPEAIRRILKEHVLEGKIVQEYVIEA